MRAALWEIVLPSSGPRNSGSIEITNAQAEIADAIAGAFAARGFDVSIVTAPTGLAQLVVFTEGLSESGLTSRHWAALSAARKARKSGASLIFLQQAYGPTGLEGLSRTLRREWPECQSSCWSLVDRVPADALPNWIGASSEDLWLSADGLARRVSLGELLSPQPITHPSQGVWLVTGGARGVTASCAIELARQAGGTFILAGRSAEAPWPDGIPETSDLKALRGLMASAAVTRGEKPAPAAIDKAARAAIAGLEIRATLAQIRAAGGYAVYLPMDTSNPASVKATLAAIYREHGRITGLVHGAGIIADRLVEEKTEDELARVFAPKAEGLFHILSRLDLSALRHIGLFSSASAFFGNRGQSDYAMANAVLANTGRALATDLPEARVKVFDWGPWEGGMVDATLASHFKQQGVPLIPLSEGARIFAHELMAGDPSDVELVVGTVWGEE